jgi:sigma-B regulation protein RsbU (phosphoserine phosphatase)
LGIRLTPNLQAFVSKNTTIFRQLIRNITIPVVMVILAFSALDYYYNQQKLKSTFDQQKNIIIDEIQNMLSLYDRSMTFLEQHVDGEMEQCSNKLAYDLLLDTKQIEKADLYRDRRILKMDSLACDIYVINSDFVVVNTTYPKDAGLDFKKFGKLYVDFLGKNLKMRTFTRDRFATESSTKRLKKYSYQGTPDGKYIIELGFYSNEGTEMQKELEGKINGLSRKFSEIRDARLFRAAANTVIDEGVKKEHLEVFKQTFMQKKNHSVMEQRDGLEITYDYIFLNIMDTQLYDGYVVMLESDNSKQIALFYDELKRLGIMLFVALLVLVTIIYFRARQITRPIEQLALKAGAISKGNLNERMEVNSNNEVGQLSQNFNEMISQLQESYNTLEQKVVERTAELSEQKNIVEHKNKEITDSIYYAKRIQNAILPQDEEFQRALPGSFVLYKPKDIVSGDFYWLTERNGKVIVAATDCTGHGVPGAFMSMIGSTFLNEIVNEKNVSSPDRILNSLRENIIRSLRQSGGESKDGMDIALCSIEPETRKVEFAGANNPLWICSRENETWKMEEIKADKQPIGIYVGDQRPFAMHERTLSKGDTIYIFTDGYADQFGGPKGKKFKYRTLQDLLLSIQGKEMNEQRGILDQTIESWKGALEQVDDILVIGIRL